MGTDSINKSSGSKQIQQTQSSLGAGMTLMSPEDIMMYMQKVLGEIGDQLNDFKQTVLDRQQKAKDLREISSTIRQMQANGGESGALSKFDDAQYNEFMTKLEKYKDSDPEIAAAYNTFMTSYGGYINTDDHQKKGVLAGEDGNWYGHNKTINPDTQDMYLSKDELANSLKHIENSQESMNSENELTMMGLQQLMQRRNQISQFGSNAINMMNEGMKSIIGNIR